MTGSGAGAVFLICSAGVALGAALVAGVRVVTDDEVPVPAAEPGRAGSDLLDGLRYLGRARGPRTVVGLLAAAAMIEGALDVLVLVVAIELAGAGPTEVGLLTSAAGLGGIVGAAAAVALVGRARLAGPFALGLLVWGMPAIVLGIVPGLVIGLAMFLIAGIGRGDARGRRTDAVAARHAGRGTLRACSGRSRARTWA